MILVKLNIFIWARKIKFGGLQVKDPKLANTGSNNLTAGVYYTLSCIQGSVKTYTLKYRNEWSSLKFKIQTKEQQV